MSSYAERLAIDIRTAYEGRDREALESTLKRMVSAITYTGPAPKSEGREWTAEEMAAGKAQFYGELRAIAAAEVAARAQPVGDGCSRKLLGCECTSQEQRSHCMFRATS